MQSVLNESGMEGWQQIAPLLDAGVMALGEKERQVILLRFFENRSLREVGLALDANEDAVEKRVSRALAKLRKFFARRGVTLSAGVIAGAVSANSVQAAPIALAKSVTAVAVAKGAAASTSTLTLIKGALKIMAWTKVKTVVVTGAAVILAAGTTIPIVVHVVHQHEATNQHQARPFFTSKTELTDADNTAYESLTGTTPAEVAKTFFDACSRDWNTVSKLWGSMPDDRSKKYLGGLEVISLGQPFRGQWNNQDSQGPQVYVPYEIRLKDGTVHKWQLAICCARFRDGQWRWYFSVRRVVRPKGTPTAA